MSEVQDAGEFQPSESLRSHWSLSANAMYALRRAIGTESIAMFTGDSRALVPFHRIGNTKCFSAFFTGATIRDMTEHLTEAVQYLQPNVVVVQAGVNHAWVPPTDRQWIDLRKDTDDLIARVKAEARHVVMTTPVPFEKSVWHPQRSDEDVVLRSRLIADVSDIIRASAHDAGVTLVDLQAEFAEDDGTARPGTTYDGVHLTASTYVRIKELLDPTVDRLVFDHAVQVPRRKGATTWLRSVMTAGRTKARK